MDPQPHSADNMSSPIDTSAPSVTSTSQSTDAASGTQENANHVNEAKQDASEERTTTAPSSTTSPPTQQGESEHTPQPEKAISTPEENETQAAQATSKTKPDEPENGHETKEMSTESEKEEVNKEHPEGRITDATSPQKTPQVKKKRTKTPEEKLLEAISTQNVKKLHEAVRAGANVNAMMMASNAPPIIVASKLCFYDVIEALLKCGANPNCIDSKGWAPLHWASVMNNLPAVRLLCIHGADIYIRTCGGKLALDLAELKKHKEVKDFLLLWIKHTDNRTTPKVPPVEVPLQPFLPRPPPMAKPPLSASGPPPLLSVPTEPRDPAKRRVCTECNTTDTPQWRRGPQGPETLCNRCGLRYSKKAVRYSPY